jgi:hypothetical protein
MARKGMIVLNCILCLGYIERMSLTVRMRVDVTDLYKPSLAGKLGRPKIYREIGV